MSIVTDTILEEALRRLKGELDLKLNTSAYTSSLNTYPNIYCWGDSFTEGVGGYVLQPDGHNAYMAYSYPAWLGQNYKALNLGARNMGMNSLRAVQGADPIVIQTGFTIPASKNTPVKIGTCTQILDENQGTGFTSRAGNLVKINKQVETAGLNPCVMGGVEGIIYREMDSNYVSNETSYDYYFKRLEDGEAIPIAAQTEVETYAMRNYRNGVGIFWIGANGGYTSNEDYVEKMQSMIKYGDYLNYLIIAGAELNDTLIGMLKIAFTDTNSFCHVIVLSEQLPYRGYALAGIDRQSVDTTGWTTTNPVKKAVPLLFEYISGQSGESAFGMHFSAWGYKAIAKLIEEKLGEMHLVNVNATSEAIEENKDKYGVLLYKSGKRVLDGNSYIDTQVKLYDDLTKKWTLVIKWHGQLTSSSYPHTVFCCSKDGSNKGLLYRYYTEGQHHLVVGSGALAGLSDTSNNIYVKHNEENIIIIAKDGSNYDLYINSSNKAYNNTLVYALSSGDETDLTCILGGRWNSSGTNVTIPTGFILDDCRIYDDALTYVDVQTLYNELKYPPNEIIATTTGAGLMSAEDKVALEEWKSLRLSVDAQGYVCQTVEVN